MSELISCGLVKLALGSGSAIVIPITMTSKQQKKRARFIRISNSLRKSRLLQWYDEACMQKDLGNDIKKSYMFW